MEYHLLKVLCVNDCISRTARHEGMDYGAEQNPRRDGDGGEVK
jgi:hypothetical protein